MTHNVTHLDGHDTVFIDRLQYILTYTSEGTR